MEILEVNDHNKEVYLNLIQGYEAEFSSITKKKPDAKGLFALDTHIGGSTRGFILYENGIPAGIAAIQVDPGGSREVCEFYVVPCYRGRSLGKRFAWYLWKLYPGNWQVKQIEGADHASVFWRKAIEEFTLNRFEEDLYEDAYWGKVTRQKFVSPLCPDS